MKFDCNIYLLHELILNSDLQSELSLSFDAPVAMIFTLITNVLLCE